MTRIKIVGLCLVVVSAFAAIAASAAQAGEYGQCRGEQKTGNYTDSNCQTVAEKKGKPDHKGKFEWFPGPSASCISVKKGEYTEAECKTAAAKKGGGGFEREPCYPDCATYTDSSTQVEFKTPSLGFEGWECAHSESQGEVTGAKTGVDVITFTNCAIAGNDQGEHCTSEGEPEGVIKTFPLETRLIDHGETGLSGDEPAVGEVWTEFVGKPEYGGYTFIYHCFGRGFFATQGSLSGITTGNINMMSSAGEMTFRGLPGEGGAGIGEQDLETEFNGSEPEFPSGIGPYPSSENGKAKTAAAAANEIKA